MPPITSDPVREIIDDFAEEIKRRCTWGARPEKMVINFRTDRRDSRERSIATVPLHLLRYRKDNGRIASDVADFERNTRRLRDADGGDQELLRKFLQEKGSGTGGQGQVAGVRDGRQGTRSACS